MSRTCSSSCLVGPKFKKESNRNGAGDRMKTGEPLKVQGKVLPDVEGFLESSVVINWNTLEKASV